VHLVGFLFVLLYFHYTERNLIKEGRKYTENGDNIWNFACKLEGSSSLENGCETQRKTRVKQRDS
jgi:hypothetical protein